MLINNFPESKVWNYFVKNNDSTITTCKYKDALTNETCNNDLKYNKNTSLMANHLYSNHRSNIKESKLPSITTGHLSIKAAFANSYSYCPSSQKYRDLEDPMCNFILQTGQLLSIVDNKHFFKMLGLFDSKYKLSTRQRFSCEIVPLKFESFKIKVMHLLNETEFRHLTTDGWTSQASLSYIGATIHFVDQNFCLKSIRISLKQSPNAHTSLYLKEQIELILNKWKINDKILSKFSDTAANIKHCLEDLMNKLYIPCF
ncbi:E3 SUMO-protein ligase ZBED1-like [Hydra vulgaris]|uniref:E3 SUMO-protein ligase ZBED1-like n=1 Tax=Hydra vulgaris TaxID=6087 RepID=A0ABM4BQ18_HYDVU